MKHKKTFGKSPNTNKGTGHGTGLLMQKTVSKGKRLRLNPKAEWEPTPGAFGGKETRDMSRTLVMKAFYGMLLRRGK